MIILVYPRCVLVPDCASPKAKPLPPKAKYRAPSVTTPGRRQSPGRRRVILTWVFADYSKRHYFLEKFFSKN